MVSISLVLFVFTAMVLSVCYVLCCAVLFCPLLGGFNYAHFSAINFYFYF